MDDLNKRLQPPELFVETPTEDFGDVRQDGMEFPVGFRGRSRNPLSSDLGFTSSLDYSINSRSRSRDTSVHSRISTRSSLRSPLRINIDGNDGNALFKNEQDSGSILDLSDDIRGALGDESNTGTWLNQEKIKQTSRRSSFQSTSENNIELQSLAGIFKGDSYRADIKVSPNHSAVDVTSIELSQDNVGRSHDLLSSSNLNRATSRLARFAGKFEDTYTNKQEGPQITRLYGKSIKIFHPFNGFRIRCAGFIQGRYYEPIMRVLLVSQTTLLAYRQWNPAVHHGFVHYGTNWADWVLLSINILFTFECFIQIVAWGLWDDSQACKALNLPYSSIQDLMGIPTLKRYFFGDRQPTSESGFNIKPNKKSFISRATLSAGQQIIHRAYLRKTWNRIDFVATVSFWISLFLNVSGAQIYDIRPVFRVLECLRILRLSNMTTRTSLLLKSIKTGGPQLVDVILFILYFMTLFAIIGVQSFKSSFRRYCVWTNPNDPADTYVSDQHCGGSYYMENGTLKKQPYFVDGKVFSERSKGFLCPVNSECRTLLNPYGNSYSFDNLVLSMQLIFVIMSGNTFTDTMYDTMDTDSMAASIFFIFGAFFLYLWMINLLIAVLSTSFSATREAIDSGYDDNIREDFNLDWHFPSNIFSKCYKKLRLLFDILIFSSIAYQCLRNKSTTEQELQVDHVVQSFISLFLFLEIIIRFSLYIPSNPTQFFKLKRNNVDLCLAIITSIISIPGVYNKMGNDLYDWFRVFFLIRIYRVVLDVRVVRKLWARVSNNFSIIFNLALFYFLFLFLASILFSRFFEGWASEDDISELQFPFNTLPNSFLGLFVVTSTENWSEFMYGMQEIAPNTSAAFFSGLLFVSWFLLSNSVILNAFIAIIGDSMRVLDNEKRKAQVVRAVHVELPRVLNPRPKIDFFSKLWKEFFTDDTPEHAHSEKETLLQDGDAIQNFLEDELYKKDESLSQETAGEDLTLGSFGGDLLETPRNPIAKCFALYFTRMVNHSWISNTRKFLVGYDRHKNPFAYSKKTSTLKDEKKYLTLPEQVEFENRNLREAQIEYLQENPMFGTSLYIFKPEHPLRKLCQKITNSSHGERLQGVQPNLIAYYIFNSIIAAVTVALVVVACFTTPLYRKKISNPDSIWDWTLNVELAFGVLFLLEFIIKVIADGSVFTPNGYFRNVWNVLDFVVLASIWTNIIAILKNDGDLSRIMRGLKALRALRILTISKTSKQIVYRVMVAGFGKIFIAGIMSFTLLFPYAVWGLNLFSAKLDVCNDGESYFGDCVNEYAGTAENWNILIPRVYSAPQLEFNRFASSLLTLFEVISLEGWTDLLQNLVNSTGVGSPPGNYTSPANAIFIVSFIFIGIIFVLTLFVSVIITNYSQMTGSAYLTLQQTSWNEVTKLLGKTHARQRPKIENLSPFKSYCYRTTVERNKSIQVILFAVLWIHMLAISLEKYPSTVALDDFRYTVYIISSSIFLVFSLMKMIAIGPRRFFRSKWNSYEVLIYAGAWVTSVMSFFISRNNGFANINKLFLVGIFTILIHRSKRLSHLLKIASASLPSLLSLIFAWGILFLVYAIAMNQIFGLTRIGPNTTDNQNLRTVTKALLLLFRCSFGEGWNYIMRDFAVEAPYCVESSDMHSDCGSMQYAYILFISWNIISMYIFVNMFVSMIYESFIYVYIDSHGTSSLDRDEIRYFKDVWSKFDPEGTGLIPLDKLPAFLRKLKGYFAFPLYTEEYSLAYLKTFIDGEKEGSGLYNVDIDLHGLNSTLNRGVKEVKKQFELYLKFLEEARYNMEVHGDLGVSFSRIIIQIPLYTKFDENNCLTLTKFLDRLILNKILALRLLNRKSVEICRMIPHRLRFLKTFHPDKLEQFRQNQKLFVSPFKTPILAGSEGFEDDFKSTEDGYWSPSKSARRSNSFSSGQNDIGETIIEADDVLHGVRGSNWGTNFTEIEPHIKAVIENHLKGSESTGSEEPTEELEEHDSHGHRRIA